jgi:hypothetical protein
MTMSPREVSTKTLIACQAFASDSLRYAGAQNASPDSNESKVGLAKTLHSNQILPRDNATNYFSTPYKDSLISGKLYGLLLLYQSRCTHTISWCRTW